MRGRIELSTATHTLEVLSIRQWWWPLRQDLPKVGKLSCCAESAGARLSQIDLKRGRQSENKSILLVSSGPSRRRRWRANRQSAVYVSFPAGRIQIDTRHNTKVRDTSK